MWMKRSELFGSHNTSVCVSTVLYFLCDLFTLICESSTNNVATDEFNVIDLM